MREYTYQFLPENYENSESPVLKITKSSFGTYQWCPKKYEFNYIERLPQDQTEAMAKGTIVHNAREDFFNAFDIKKAENLSYSELVNYNMSLHPIDDYSEMYETISIFEANRFLESKEDGTMDNFVPVVNEILFDAEITIDADTTDKYPLSRDYVVHLQGIVDRMLHEAGSSIPMALTPALRTDPHTKQTRKQRESKHL